MSASDKKGGTGESHSDEQTGPAAASFRRAKKLKPKCPNFTESPAEQERAASHALWVQLRTRIATQYLPDQSGYEEGAVHSLFSLFGTTRELLTRYPLASTFREEALKMLNDVIRPYTTRWEGWLVADAREGSDREPTRKFKDAWTRRNFRRELVELQGKLKDHVGVFQKAGTSSVEAYNNKPDPILGKKISSELLGVDRHQERTKTAYSSDILDAETRELRRLREDTGRDLSDEDTHAKDTHAKDAPCKDVTGLALSGGGIRSATFCLGVVQSLARRDLLPQFDYLSTVSGGGYLGAFLSGMLGTSAPPPPKDKPSNTDKGTPEAPDGKDLSEKDRLRTRIKRLFLTESGGGLESEPVRHLRNNSKYLLDGGFLASATGIGIVFAGILFNLLIVAVIPLILAFVVSFLNYFLGSSEESILGIKGLWGTQDWISRKEDFLTCDGALLAWLSAISLGTLAILAMVYPGIRSNAKEKISKNERSASLRFCVASSKLFLVLSGAVIPLWMVPTGFRCYNWLRSELLEKVTEHVSSLESLLALFGVGVGTVMARLAANPSFSGWKAKLLRLAVILLGPLFIAWVFFAAGTWIMFSGSGHGFSMNWAAVVTIGGTVIALLAWMYFLLDVNIYSPHLHYRHRLTRCYLQSGSRESGGNNAFGKVQNSISLGRLSESGPAPYHLINANVNLPNSKERELRGRNGDFFLFSKYYCGSPICGYHSTEDLVGADRHLDLGSAMAISGAAASSNMGWKTNNAFRMVMTIANIRLGYWLPNLRTIETGNQSKKAFETGLEKNPGPISLLKEMFSFGMDERAPFLNVSDGGHIENLAVYELLRRKCKFIVCVDAGCEPDMECRDLMRLERYAALDFGIKMHYDISDLQLQENGYSRAYGTLIKIDYGAGSTHAEGREKKDPKEAEWGWMLYLKLAMVGYGKGYVLDYERDHPEFPHQTTGDQLFDEAQFEAYRALGEAAAESMLVQPDGDGKIEPDTTDLVMEAWFKKLARSLLPDNDEVFQSSSTSDNSSPVNQPEGDSTDADAKSALP